MLWKRVGYGECGQVFIREETFRLFLKMNGKLLVLHGPIYLLLLSYTLSSSQLLFAYKSFSVYDKTCDNTCVKAQPISVVHNTFSMQVLKNSSCLHCGAIHPCIFQSTCLTTNWSIQDQTSSSIPTETFIFEEPSAISLANGRFHRHLSPPRPPTPLCTAAAPSHWLCSSTWGRSALL